MINCTFDITDSSGNEIYGKLYISPLAAPIAYGSQIISNDTVIVLEKGNSVVVNLVPNAYTVCLVGFNAQSEFFIDISMVDDGSSINAKNYIVNTIPVPNFSASYAISSTSASFAQTASYAVSAVSSSYSNADSIVRAGGGAISLGLTTPLGAFNSTVLGEGASAPGNEGQIVIGNGAKAGEGDSSITIGYLSSVQGQSSIMIGGPNNSVQGENSIALGNSNISASNSVAIGNGLNVTEDNQIVIGNGQDVIVGGTLQVNNIFSQTGSNLVIGQNTDLTSTITFDAEFGTISLEADDGDVVINSGLTCNETLYVTETSTFSDVIVNGVLHASQISASQFYITSSNIIVTDNILTLNASTPHVRYSGIQTYDSGSTNNKASILWDGLNDYYFISASNAGYHRKFILGPDIEGNLTANYLPIASSSNNIVNSIVSQIGNSLLVSGNVSASSVTASLFGVATSALSASYTLSSSFANTASYSLNTPVSNYTTLTTSSTNWITASFSIPEQYVNITNAALYNFTCSNLPSGTTVLGTSVYINNTSSTTSSLLFPSNWVFLGSVPTSITSSKSAMLNLKAYGSNIVAGFGVQY